MFCLKMKGECQRLYATFGEIFVYWSPEGKWKMFCHSVSSSHPSRLICLRAGFVFVILFRTMVFATIFISDFPSQ